MTTNRNRSEIVDTFSLLGGQAAATAAPDGGRRLRLRRQCDERKEHHLRRIDVIIEIRKYFIIHRRLFLL